MGNRRKHLTPFYWFIGAAVIACIIIFPMISLISAVLPTNPRLADLLSQVFAMSIGMLIGVSSLFVPWHRSPSWRGTLQSSRLSWQRGPLLLCCAFFCYIVSIAIDSYSKTYRIYAYPSLSDIPNLCIYIFLLFTIFTLPTYRVSSNTYSRITLDSLLIMTAVLTFSWYFLLGPVLLQRQGTLLAKATDIVYEFFDLVLFFSLLLLSSRASDRRLRPTKYLLLFGLLCLVSADSLNLYARWQPGHQFGLYVMMLVSIAMALLIICTYFMSFANVLIKSQSTTLPTDSKSDQMPAIWLSLLPYLLVPAVGSLVLYAWHINKQGSVENGTYVGGAMLLGQILLRQVFTIREIRGYARQLFQANARLESLAVTDPLTEIPNHRALVSILDKELQATDQGGQICSLLFLDIDHFKALNDGYGHGAGDTILYEFAQSIRQVIRERDAVGRWGGEEFVVILSETDQVEARHVAERIRTTIGSRPFTVGGGIHLTCSIGVASYPTHAHNRELLVSAADYAMYAAKSLGRNQVRSTDDEAVTTLQATGEANGGRDELAVLGVVKALAALVEVRDALTDDHSQQVADLLQKLGQDLGLTSAEANMIALAGRLHDIGKIAVPDAILRKSDDLTDEEWVLMKTHPIVGAEVISNIPSLRPIVPIIRAHHERWDGQGYPDGLSGEGIPFGARLISVVDAYTAMTVDRPYKKARSPQVALEELRRGAGTQFDAHVVEALIKLIQKEEHQQHPEMISVA